MPRARVAAGRLLYPRYPPLCDDRDFFGDGRPRPEARVPEFGSVLAEFAPKAAIGGTDAPRACVHEANPSTRRQEMRAPSTPIVASGQGVPSAEGTKRATQ
jgi:hypothetical protein